LNIALVLLVQFFDIVAISFLIYSAFMLLYLATVL